MTRLNLPGQRAAIAAASLLKRILAFVADLIIVQLVVITPFGRIVKSIVGDDPSIISGGFSRINELLADTSLTLTLTYIMAAIGLLTLLYFAVFEYRMQQTPGKMLFSIFVASEGMKRLELPKLWQCIVRSLFLIPIIPFALLWIIDPLFMLISPRSQRLSEQISKTVVVERITY